MERTKERGRDRESTVEMGLDIRRDCSQTHMRTRVENT